MTAFLLFAILVAGFTNHQNHVSNAWSGAWKNNSDKGEIVMMMDDYFVFTKYDLEDRKFIQTWGGPYSLAGDKMTVKVEFDYMNKERVGKTAGLQIGLDEKRGLMIRGDLQQDMREIDNGTGPLAGNWRITGRKRGETISEMPRRARKTLKMLTGSRFQWMAINTETGDFSGTGGGTYTFEQGKYTEHIEFFSRDSSRVGASLSFDGKIVDGKWHHSGLSSRGDPIYEIWSRENEE